MQATIALDDELVEKAQAFTGPQDISGLVRQALESFVKQRELAKRLSNLGGSQPDLAAPTRRRLSDGEG
jgi:hypothetical protein